MSLRKAKIGKVKKLSLAKVKLPESEPTVLKQKANDEERAREITKRIKDTRERIKNCRGKFEECTNSRKAMERKFKEIAGCCDIQWFRPKWMTGPSQNKYREILYWCT